MNWHVKAARVAAQNPSWSWSKVCAHVARRRTPHLKKPSAPAFAARLEQLKLF